ncbi:MAG: hypothetical protein EXS58_13670 [Candidatus Latescibacteria bacterium]|nr:hypothetical protein [Candidatus Latescibacterota bacterium]
MAAWQCVLELDEQRRIVSGSAEALGAAIGRGADLRIGTCFRHNEHIDTASANPELIEEVAEFRVTYLMDGPWAAGIMTLRQPVGLPDSFGPRPSMSFFLYNQDGTQAIARPHLDGQMAAGPRGSSSVADHPDMPRYHQFDNGDALTNAPSHNFVYDFGHFRFLVRDEWREVCATAADGQVVSGSVAALAEAFTSGCEVKVGISGLCGDLGEGPTHEVFVQTHSGYYYTEQGLFIAGTHPLVRVAPSIPLRYGSGNWDFGWLLVRTDGQVKGMICDPYTLAFSRPGWRCPLRWFVR